MEEFDVIVVGGGSGAKLAHSLADLGYHVAIVDHDLLGGTCLNHGCIPSKMLIHTAELARQIERASLFNLRVERVHCEFAKLVKRVTDEVTRHAKEMAVAVKKNSRMNFFQSQTEFVDAKTLRVGNRNITAKRIFIASGARPYIPEIQGLKETPYLTSREALRLEKRPSHLVIIGGGYIAAELGFFYSALGANVTVITRGKFLSREEEDVQREFLQVFGKYATVHLNTHIRSVSFQGESFKIVCEKGTIQSDQLLVAAGIRGSTEELGLQKTQIRVDKEGFIPVNRYLRTREKHIWTFGDVIGPPFFRHRANFDAEYLLQSQFLSKKPFPVRYPPIPHAIFSYPQVASVGKSERQLKKGSYRVGRCNYEDTARGMAILPEGGFVKLLFEKKSKRLLGAQIVGEEASTMCHILSAFIQKKAHLQDLVRIIYIHPSLPEAISGAAKNALEKFR